MDFLSVCTVCNNIFCFEINKIWLLPCPSLPRMHQARSCLNSLQKPYDPMVFLRTAGDAKKARHCLMIQAITHKVSVSICMNFLSLSTVGKIIFYFEMNRIWLLSCPLLPRMHLAHSCLNGLQKPYDPMVFLRTAGDATKAGHCLMIQAITHKVSASICMNFLSLSTVSKIIFYFEMNRIWLLPCPLLPRMHLACSCLNSLQNPYDPMVFLCTAGDATKARHRLMIQAITRKMSVSICMNFLSLSTVSKTIFYFEINKIWLLPCPSLPRMHLAHSCLNRLQKPYDPMVFLHNTGNAMKARHHLVRMTETCNQLM